jgi:hypothetical protein
LVSDTERMDIALLDACVLYPAPLRDFLIRLANAGAYSPRWSSAIHEEWISSVLEDRPELSRTRLERTSALMNASAPDAMVEGYEQLIQGLILPDLNDRHVLAAAIQAEAKVIVTFNLADFPSEVLASHGLVAEHPDHFVCRLLDRDDSLVVKAFERQWLGLRNPPQTTVQLLSTLERQGLTQASSRLRRLVADQAL